jgi:hypothetical protein
MEPEPIHQAEEDRLVDRQTSDPVVHAKLCFLGAAQSRQASEQLMGIGDTVGTLEDVPGFP